MNNSMDNSNKFPGLDTGLRNAANLYRLLIQNLPQTRVLVFDKDLRFIIAEGSIFPGLPYSKEGIVGKTLQDAVSPESVSILEPYYRMALDGQATVFEREFREHIYRVNILPIRDEAGDISAGMVVSVDITEEREAEQALRDSEEKYRSLFDNSLDGVLLTTANGMVLMANAEACNIFKLTEAEIIQRGRSGLVDLTDSRLERALQERERSGFAAAELRMIRSDGSVFPAELRSRIYYTSKNEQFTSIIVRDLTEHKLAEQRASELVLEKERIRLLTDFIHDISHHFRTPLSVIQSSAYIAQKVKDPVKQTQHLKQIEEQVLVVTEMIESMLLMSRLSTYPDYKFVPVNINRLLDDVIVRLSHATERKSLAIIFQPDPNLMMIPADEIDLSIALFNIIKNAIDYNQVEGKIEIRTSTQISLDGAAVAVEIEDTGIGISAEELPYIFNTFYRANTKGVSQTGHAGFGLAVAQMIIAGHRGWINVGSEIGKGSVFRVILPIVPAT